MSLRKLLVTTAVALAAALFVLAASPAAAQDDQEEALAYHAYYAATLTNDNAKAIEAAEAYLKSFPNGENADYIRNWLSTQRMTMLNDAIKAGQVDEMIAVGEKILANDPENLNVLWALAFHLRRLELLATPRTYDHAAEAVKYAKATARLVEGGKTLAGVQSFDKDAHLAWLYQSEAMVEANKGSAEKARALYEKSTALAPLDPGIAARNLLEMLTMHQSTYGDAAQAYNALPEEDRSAAEPSEEVKAARARVDAEADGLIDVAARFVALADAKGLPQATRDQVYGVLETVYKSRFPEDDGTGLQSLLDSKK